MKRTALSILFIAVLATGCGKSKGPSLPKPVDAKGFVFLPDGQPMKAGRLELKPTSDKGTVEAFADINSDGSFVLMSYTPGDGAVPGSYKVTISPYDYRSKSGNPQALPDAKRIPSRYLEAASSDITVEIKNESNSLDIRLKP